MAADYDAVLAIESLIHARELERTVVNLAGGLRSGGLLLVLDDMATCDLDVRRLRDAILVRENWGCPGAFPTDGDFRRALVAAGLTVVGETDLSPLMRIRSAGLLARQQRTYTLLRRAIPLAPVHSVLSAFLGGVALERLHGLGDVDYRLIVARNDPPPARPAGHAASR